MKNNKQTQMLRFFILGVFIFSLYSCSGFKHGFTNERAKDYYHLITWNKEDFGTKRLAINRRFFNNTDFACFISNSPKPDFMLEYIDTGRRETIQLYYVTIDSVFIFKECKPNKIGCVNLVDSRVLTKQELLTYETLKKQTLRIKRSNI